MLEFIPCTTSEENLSTMERLASNIYTNPIVYQQVTSREEYKSNLFFFLQPLLIHSTCPPAAVHHKLSRLKDRLKCRHAHPDSDREKNQGYLVVDTPDSEPILVPNGSIDHQQTQHDQSCVEISDVGFDLNQTQYSSFAAVSPNSSLPRQTYLGFYQPFYQIRK